MPHPCPTTFEGWGKPVWGKAGRGGAKLPSVMAVGGRKKKRKKEENKAKHNGRSEYIFFS